MTTPGRGTRPIKEAFFVQVVTSDDNLVFFDETSNLGRKMPYGKPEATVAMRASSSTVSFCLFKYTNRTRTTALEQRLELPRKALDRTDRRAETMGKDLPENTIAVEYEDKVYFLNIKLDENGVATLESREGEDDEPFDLPKGRVSLTMVMHSPRGSKIISTGYQGYMGKPGVKENITRVAAMTLNLLSGLSAFRLVSGIEVATVPSSPARYLAVRPTMKASDRVHISVPVRLWSGDENPQPVGATILDVELDLETANPISGRLLFHVKVPPEAAEAFAPYQTLVTDAALSLVTAHLGPDEVSELVYSIALGELGGGDIERLREAVATITGLELSPRQWVPFVPSPVA